MQIRVQKLNPFRPPSDDIKVDEMKVRFKEVYLARRYKPGMEDGFLTMFHSPEDKTRFWLNQLSKDDVSVEMPYKLSNGQHHVLLPNNWIMEDSTKRCFVIDEESLMLLYEEVNENGISVKSPITYTPYEEIIEVEDDPDHIPPLV